MQFLFKHAGSNQRMATFGHAETPRPVGIQVNTNLRAFRNHRTAVYDRSVNLAVLHYFAFRQEQRFRDHAV